MQLFNIGTVQLNEDGTLQRDANGDEIDSYSNLDIMNFAREFTLDITFRSSSFDLWLIVVSYLIL